MKLPTLACAVVVLLAMVAQAATPSTRPEYPVPYEPPTVEQITQVLDRIRTRLDAVVATRIIERGTDKEIAELTKPSPDAILDPGPDRFSPYSYSMGVVYTGMLHAGDVTQDPRYAEFVAKRFQFFADNLPKLSSWPDDDLPRNPFRQLIAPGSLDDCGSIGASMVRGRRMKVGPDLKQIIDCFADYITYKQMRLDDGTLARSRPFAQSLWIDDAYMSVPFLAQMGALTGEKKYFDDAARQIKQFHAHLFVPAKGLFRHGGNMANADNHPKYFWGRGNGWVFMATVELLDLLPQDHPDRDALINILRAHAEGLASAQSGEGLWHQMLDREDSYLETSCSAMFTYAMAKAVNRGWLNASAYGPVAQAGWNGLSTRVSEDGHLSGVCIGTSYGDDFVYYYHRPARDDIHGYGPTLMAGAEMIRLVKNDRIRITGSSSRPTLYLEKE